MVYLHGNNNMTKGNENDMWDLSENQREILERKYKLPGETDHEFIYRVAKTAAQAENPQDQIKWCLQFYDMIKSFDFIPGGSILANAGIPTNIDGVKHYNGGLANCSAISVEDNIESIAQAGKDYVVMAKHRLGVGIDLTPLSGRNRALKRTKGKEKASGVVSMMRVITDGSTQMSLGGSRRSAGLIALRWSHPDAVHFINCKRGSIVENVYNPDTEKMEVRESRRLQHVNLSMLLDEKFWKELDSDGLHATRVWDEMAKCAVETGDPRNTGLN